MKNLSVVSALLGGIVVGVSLVSFAGCKGGGGAGTVAVVNGSPITQDEYMRYLMLKQVVDIQSPQGPVSAPVAEPLGFQALNDLVRQKILIQMAKDENVYPTDDQVTKEIQFQVDGDPNWVRNLNGEGLDTNMIKQVVAANLCQYNLITKGVTVSPQDVDNYIKNNPDKFTNPPSFDLDWILVKSEAAKKQVDDDLRRGQPFDTTAMRYSEASDAKEAKGAFKFHQLKQLPPELQTVIKNLQPLKTTDWVKGTDGWAKFYMIQKQDASKVPISEHIREQVRRYIAMQRGTNAGEIANRIQDKLKASNVDVKLTGLQGLWSQYQAQLQAQNGSPSIEQAANGTTAGTPGAPGAAAPGTGAPAGTGTAPTTAAGTPGGK